MRDLDKMIDEALGKEEGELLRRIGGDPNFFERALGMFGAGVEWTVVVLAVVQGLLFVGGVWAAWMFFEASDVETQLRYGLPAAVVLLASLVIKMGVTPLIHHNRTMRELKRIELQIARASSHKA